MMLMSEHEDQIWLDYGGREWEGGKGGGGKIGLIEKVDGHRE